MVMKIPASMYGKGPKNNPSPGKSWDTSGRRAYGDSELRNLNTSADNFPFVDPQELVDLTVLRKKK